MTVPADPREALARRWAVFEDEDHVFRIVTEGTDPFGNDVADVTWPEMGEDDVERVVAAHNRVVDDLATHLFMDEKVRKDFAAAAETVHLAFCDPDHELVGQWDRDMAEALKRNGYTLAARQDEPSPALREAAQAVLDAVEPYSTGAPGQRWTPRVGHDAEPIIALRRALAANPPQTREAEGAAGYDGGDDDAAMVATAEKPVLRVATPSGDEAVRPGDGANDRGDRGVRGGDAADAADAADSSRLAQALPGFVPGNWLRRNVVLSAYRRAPEAEA